MNIFQTKDFYHAVILKTYGLELTSVEKGKHKFSVFVFKDTEDEATEIIAKYWNHNLKLEARDLVENISELKSRIYSEV